MNIQSFVHDHTQCTLCGRCLEVCPLFKLTQHEELSPRGKAFLLQKISMSEISAVDASTLAGLCLGCAKCAKVCPQQINLPLKISLLKAAHPRWKDWIWSRILLKSTLFPPLLRFSKDLLPGLHPMLEAIGPDSENCSAPIKLKTSVRKQNQEAVIFPGCFSRFLRPDLEYKARAVLSSLGFKLLPTPDWQCCGFALLQAGFLDKNALCRLTNINIWKSLGRPRIYTFCATCVQGLEGKNNPSTQNDLQKSFVSSIRSLSELIPLLSFQSVADPLKTQLIWHTPCHGSEKTGSALKKLLNMENMDISLSSTQCCGLGGAFRLLNKKMSLDLAYERWHNLHPSADAHCLSECSGCIIQLGSTRPSGVRVSHWLDLFEAL